MGPDQPNLSAEGVDGSKAVRFFLELDKVVALKESTSVSALG